MTFSFPGVKLFFVEGDVVIILKVPRDDPRYFNWIGLSCVVMTPEDMHTGTLKVGPLEDRPDGNEREPFTWPADCFELLRLTQNIPPTPWELED